MAARRVVLVDLYWTRDKDPRVPLGHASLLAALRARTQADVRSIVVAVNGERVTPGRVASRILEQARGARREEVDVALGAYVWAEDHVQGVIRELRPRGFDGRIILGGPQITYAEVGVAQLYPDVDVFVRGYGEEAMCVLADDPGQPSIVGVHYAGDSDMGEQTRVDLSLLPSPWLTKAIPLSGQRFVRWETQRGCPYRCAFCQHKEPSGALLQLGRNRKLARDRILEEIALFSSSGVEDIAVLDPIFNLGPRSVDLLEEFSRRRFAGRLSLQCRAELIDKQFLDAAARLRVRLEFGLQTIHQSESDAVRRGNNMDRVDAALDEVRRRAIEHEVSLIFGLPEQTFESFVETVDWCLRRRVPVIRAFPLMLLRGTELDAKRDTWGLVDDGTSMPVVVGSNTFGRDEWDAMARLSEALRRTEGRHPSTIGDLLRLSRGLDPQRTRWRPSTGRGVSTAASVVGRSRARPANE